VPVTGIADGLVALGRHSIRARWIVGADGSSSRVRRWAGLAAHSRYSSRFGFRRHFRIRPWTEYMELHWSDHGQIYVTPVAPDEICVAVISRDSRLRLQDALRYFPELEARLTGVWCSTERGAASVTCRLRAVSQGRTALIGDASGSVDAITGEGLCLSFQQAHALGQALAAGDLSIYERAHRGIGGRPAFMADLMLLLEGRPRLRRAAMGALAAQPRLFRGMLAVHVGAAGRSPALLEKPAKQLDAFRAEDPFHHLDGMVEQFRIGDPELAAHAAEAQVAGAEDEAANTGGHQGARAHYAGL